MVDWAAVILSVHEDADHYLAAHWRELIVFVRGPQRPLLLDTELGDG